MYLINQILKHFGIVCLATGLLSTQAYAGLNDDLNSFFSNMGYGANVSNAGFYQGQQAGYLTGGSLFVRAPQKNLQPFYLDVPNIRAGCGGIDIHTGGFSFIKADALIQFGKTVIQDAPAYLADLALQTWAPQIKTAKDYLQKIAQEINSQSMNSCQTAQTLVSGIWPFKNQESQKHICSAMSTQSNWAADWVESQHKCGKGGKGDEFLDKAKEDPALKNMVMKNRNVIWYAILSNEFLQRDKDLAQIYMSLTGTIIYDAKGAPKTYPSLLNAGEHKDNDIIKALMDGGEAMIYHCDDKSSADKCLNITFNEGTKTTIAPEKGLRFQVLKIINAILDKISNDKKLTDFEKNFLDNSSIPVFQMIVTAMQSGMQPDAALYAHLLAEDLIKSYLEDVLKIVRYSLAVKGQDQEGVDIKNIYTSIAEAQMRLSQMRSDTYRRLQGQMAMINQMMRLQERIEGEFSTQTKANLDFGEM